MGARIPAPLFENPNNTDSAERLYPFWTQNSHIGLAAGLEVLRGLVPQG